MKIKVTERFSLVSQEAGYDLIETVTRNKLKEGEKGFKGEKSGETYEATNTVAYNVSIEHAISRIIHLNLHDKKEEYTLKDFINEMREVREKISKLIN